MRLHVSLTVADIEQSKLFYSALFAHAPTMEREGYVQWLLDDPKVNFVNQTGCGATPGLSHLGVQAENADEFETQSARVTATGTAVLDEGMTTCCFARSTKNWTRDPDGMRWENFLTHERTGEYGSASMPDLA